MPSYHYSRSTGLNIIDDPVAFWRERGLDYKDEQGWREPPSGYSYPQSGWIISGPLAGQQAPERLSSQALRTRRNAGNVAAAPPPATVQGTGAPLSGQTSGGATYPAVATPDVTGPIEIGGVVYVPATSFPTTAPPLTGQVSGGTTPGNPQGQAPSASTAGTASQQPVTPTPLDPYARFKAEFARLVGRDITDAEMADNAFVASLSNALLTLVPNDRLIGFSLGRLWSLPDDRLMDLPPALLAQFPNERLASFSRDFLNTFITDLARRAELGLPVQTSGGATPGGGSGGGASPPASPAPSAPGSPPGAAPSPAAPGSGSPAGNGPSQGPNISLVFPGYHDAHPDVDIEGKYAAWRDERRAKGEDPYDMVAFRQHLVALGAPDPGDPRPVSPDAPSAAPVPPGTKGAAEQVPGTAPGTSPSSAASEDIPASHAWLIQVGAQDWARALRAGGIPWASITQSQLRTDMAAAWARRMTNPKYAALGKLAQQYFAQTGWWPTEVEFNRYTQHLKGVPAITASGPTDLTLIPKPSDAPAPGEKVKWEVPPDPLPPGYEWRFASDGTPVPYKTTAGKDLFSGFYQDPKTGNWTYDPLLGAADYLNSTDPAWRTAIEGWIAQTGRLPNLEEARGIAAQALWAKADPATRDRAARFAQFNGFWPTPWELEHGPSSTPDANAGGGGQGAAGVGTVPVYVPGLGVVLTQGSPMGQGGVVFDPFSGIPGSVSPWVKEVLNGTMTPDQAPPQMRSWIDYALQKFRDGLTVKHPEEIPWGIPAPHVGDAGSRTDSKQIDAAASKPAVEDPNVTAPTTMPDGSLHIPPKPKEEPTTAGGGVTGPTETGGVVTAPQPAYPAPGAQTPAPAVPVAPVVPAAPVPSPQTGPVEVGGVVTVPNPAPTNPTNPTNPTFPLPPDVVEPWKPSDAWSDARA